MQPTLSPPSLLQLEPGARLVLPSPNGSHLTTQAQSRHIFTACLRNHGAVAAAQTVARTILVVPAGERWPDGSMRPALEDWLGPARLSRN